MNITDIFKKIGSFFSNLFRGVNQAKVREVLTQIAVMADEGLKVAEMVAKLTPTPADDLIVDALKTLNLTASQILYATDKALERENKLALATEVLKRRLMLIIQKQGKVQIGDQVIATVGDLLALDPVIFRTAAQAGYAIYKTVVANK